MYYGDLVERDGLYYEKFSDVPYTGKVTGRQKGHIKNGKRDGKYLAYRDNGQLWFKEFYKNGEREGESVCYYESGQLEKKGTYKNGLREGEWIYSDLDGNINDELTGTYENDKKISD